MEILTFDDTLAPHVKLARLGGDYLWVRLVGYKSMLAVARKFPDNPVGLTYWVCRSKYKRLIPLPDGNTEALHINLTCQTFCKELHVVCTGFRECMSKARACRKFSIVWNT